MKRKQVAASAIASGPDRAADILSAAGDLFLQHGFEGVSLEMIVSETGGSFRDLYREFGSKEKLFLRVLQSLCDEVLAPLDEAEKATTLEPVEPLESVLSELGRNILTVLLSPRLVALHRLILSESKRFPAFAKKWYEEGPNRSNQIVATLLLRYTDAGHLVQEDPCLLAAVFLDSLINNLQLRRLSGIEVSAAEKEERVRVCVKVFLRGALAAREPGLKA